MNDSSDLTEMLRQVRSYLPYLKETYKVNTLQVFGSYVRGEERETSDLDLLVTFVETPSLLQFIEMENYLSDNLGVQVDLVMESALIEPLQDFILGEAVQV